MSVAVLINSVYAECAVKRRALTEINQKKIFSVLTRETTEQVNDRQKVVAWVF